ncbi:unnamed protein product [Parajaminaea phylloscopi]
MVFAARFPSRPATSALTAALRARTRPEGPSAWLRASPSISSSQQQRHLPCISAFHSSAASRAAATTPASGISLDTSAVASTSTNSIASGGDGGILSSLSSVFDGIVPYVHQLPELFHLPAGTPHAYAISIVLATILLRSTITLPGQLWANARTTRMKEQVVPRWNILKGKDGLPKLMMQKARREGKSFEEYKTGLESELKAQIRRLLTTYKCRPLPTVLVPLALSVPLFIATSFSLRQGLLPPSPLLSEIIPWWSTPDDALTRSFEASAQMLRDRGMDPASLQMLSRPHGPSLGERDPTMFAPVSLGLLLYLNVELNAWARRANATALKLSNDTDTGTGTAPAATEPSSSTSAEPTTPAGDGGAKTKTGESEPPEPSESLATRVVSTGLKGLSILFVVVASQAPTGLVIYWLTNAVYTLGVTGYTAMRERRRIASSIRARASAGSSNVRLTGASSSSNGLDARTVQDELRGLQLLTQEGTVGVSGTAGAATATTTSTRPTSPAASPRPRLKKSSFAGTGGDVGRARR